MMRHTVKTLKWLILGLGLIMAGCYPSEEVTVSELDLVVTVPDESIDYSSFQTYSLPD